MATINNDDREHEVEQAVLQFLDAQLRGSASDMEELVKKYPEFEDKIRQKIAEFQKVDSLFDSLVQADESDFDSTTTGPDLVGRKIGGFEIKEIIGRGGMGVVYLARDTKLDRPVAIKSMPAELQASSTAQARFQREAKLLASLNHPNIAAIYEIVEEKKSGYLILEYIPGETLAERIANKPLKLEEALSIGQQIAEAVSAAHEKGVVHRDLKPGNIKIMPDGRVKVLDFGLAKTAVSEGKHLEATVTQPGRVMGTPAYMSPEQACGKPTDKRSDIWSFGCIMYQMLTGQLPFEGETATDTLARIIERQPDWEKLPQDTPTNIRTLLRRCLEKKPQRRLRDVGDAVIEISETLNTPVTAPPVTTPSSTSLKPQVTTRYKLRTAAIIIAAAIMIVLAVIAVQLLSEKKVQPSLKEIRLVVLPFENLGSTEDEYFADGVSEEIMSRLSAISTLGVISRTSAIQYKNSNKTIDQIGQELGVEYVLEGTVRWERPSEGPSRVRITPQLIRVPDDTHLWSDRYDAVLDDIFEVQSDIAERVAKELDITLLEPERQALKARPTQNMEAYDYYMRGNKYLYRGYLENDFRTAIQMYEKAVELDPTFALAFTRLARAHDKMYWLYHDHSEERLKMEKKAVDKAFQLNPNLPEAHMALGWYYYHGHLDYNRALEQFAIARKSQPNNSKLLEGIGYVQRRQGKYEQALINIKKGSELDPLSNVLALELAATFSSIRKFPEAERYYERAISLAPDLPQGYSFKASLYLRWQGSTEKAREALEKGLENVKSAENTEIVNSLINVDVFDGNYQEALDRLSLKSEDINNQHYFIPTAQRYALIYRYMNKNELAKKYYDEARSILESKIEEAPEDARLHSSLGIAYAGLGRKEDAIREGKLGVELLPVTKDAARGRSKVWDLARIYVMVGEYDVAIDQLEHLLSIPGPLSIPLLRLDPAWDPLCNHPRFKKLIESGK